MAELIGELEMLFQELGQKHHDRFLDTDGVDPEWPLWYAGWLIDKLPPLLDAKFTRSELVYRLVHLSKKQPEEAPDMPWTRYYAWFFAREHVGEGTS